MSHLLHHKNVYIVFLADIVLISASWYFSYAIRFDFQIPLSYLDTMYKTLPWLLSVKLITFVAFHLYQGMWRYTNLTDVLNIIRAIVVSSGIVILAVLLVYHFEGFPRSVFILDVLLTLLFIIGLRVGIRLYYTGHSGMQFFPMLSRLRLKSRKFFFIETSSIVIDVVLITASLYLAYAIRFEFDIPESHFYAMLFILPLVLFIKVSVFTLFHIYQGIWHFVSLVDLCNVLKAVIVSSGVIMIELLFMHRFEGYPRSVYIIDCGLTFLFICGVRVSARLYYHENGNHKIFCRSLKRRQPQKRLLIIGAGDAGEKVIREILENPHLNLLPVGLLDDRPETHGKTVHGVEILGSIAQIDSFCSLFDEILIAVPSASAKQMHKIVAACQKTGKQYRTIPALEELINGNVSIKAARNVTLQDLLGREEVVLSKANISSYLYAKRVLVTGAGGSIGSELVRQICQFHPDALALVEMSEFNLFHIERECHQYFGAINVTGFLADIRDRKSLHQVFKKFHPQVVFHTAAYKHVPLQELHPWEAVHNNILGTRNLVQIARDFLVEKFVLVSTDKAVRPTNVMGATKRVAEQLVVSANCNTINQFMVVRFGNVMGSSGSVIPIFQEQIAQGGPVTVTHPNVTRYFMSIPEAAQLILEAGAKGKGGEIFILDMGKPVRIADLAREMIRLNGYEPERDIAIHYMGLRPGEKLYEELITVGEGIVKTDHEKIMVLKGNGCDRERLQAQIKSLFMIARTYDAKKIKQHLHDIIPEYIPQIQGSPRKNPRYPSDIPLVYQLMSIANAQKKEHLCNISRGGLCFHSQRSLEQGTDIFIQFPYISPKLKEKGIVVWCHHNDTHCEIGVKFIAEDEEFYSRIVEYVCGIEEYKRKEFEQKGKKLSGEEVVRLWAQNHT